VPRRHSGNAAGAGTKAALSQNVKGMTIGAALREATVKAGPLFATGHAATGLVSAKVAALTRGAMTAMMITKLKLAAALLLATCVLGIGSGLLTYRTRAAEITMNLSGDPPPAARQTDQPAKADQAPVQESNEPAPATQKTGKAKKRDPKGDKQISAKEVLTKSFKMGKRPRLIVALQNGAVEIAADADGSIDARVTKEAKADTQEAAQDALKSLEVNMEQEGDTVKITSRMPAKEKRGTHASASAVLRVPPGTTLDAQTANGAVSLTGSTGEARIETSNGAIRVRDCTSALDLKTANGAISVTGGAGQVKATTANGSVEIQGARAVVTAHSTNGALHFKGMLGKGQQSFHTNNGSIVLELPADARFRVEAETVHGRVTSEFSIASSAGKTKNRLSGTTGEDASTTLKLHTQNGSITLKRQKAAD